MIFFKTRAAARAFAAKNKSYKFLDLKGANDHRWAVKVLNKS